jgi:dipeptidyl aminopeptidase/acylaminoacyl peptidase
VTAHEASHTGRGFVAQPVRARPARRHRLRRILLSILVAVLIVAAGAVGGVGWVGSERMIHQPQKTFARQVADYPNLRGEEIAVPSSTGVTIAGTFFPGTSRATIVISHGYGNNRHEVLPWADFLNRAGYSTFIYDMRSRGASGGDAITFGGLEQHDLVSIVDYLAGRPDVDPDRIGAIGVSLGGVTTILAAAREPRIKAVVDDCAYDDPATVVNTAFEHFIGLPAFPFGPVSLKLAELRTGQDASRIRAVDAVGQISPRPILIIHGMADQEVPYGNSERMYAAAGEPKSLWLVPGAKHGLNKWEIARDEYERRVADFFRQNLGE